MSALPSLNHLVNKQGESISHWFGHWFTHGRPFDSDCELYLLICLLIHPWFTLWEDRAFQWLIDLPCDQPCSNTGAITNSLIHLLIHPVATLCGSWADQCGDNKFMSDSMSYWFAWFLTVPSTHTAWACHELLICLLNSVVLVIGRSKGAPWANQWAQQHVIDQPMTRIV
jgi:hypothetical protein